MTCSDAYVLTWVSAHGQFECLAASGAPTGAAGGVLGGTYPSPTFAGGASFNANAATFLNGAGSFTSPGTANARITFSNVASATMTLTGVAVKAVVTCWDSSVSPARLFIPDSVEQTDADTLTFNFSPNATGYCDGSTGIGLTGATGPAGPAGGVSSLTGTANQIVVSAATGAITVSLGTGIDATKIGAGAVSSTEFGYLDGVTSAIQTQLDLKAPLASPTFTGTVTVGTSLSVDPTTGIATSSKIGNVALSGLTGPIYFDAGVPRIATGTCNSSTVVGGDGACVAVSSAYTAITGVPANSILGNNTGSTANAIAMTALSLHGNVGSDQTGGTLPSLPANSLMYAVGANARITSGSIGNPAFLTSARWDGTVGSLTAVQSGDQIGGYNSFAYDGATLIGPLGSFRCFANQTQSVGAGGTYCEVATTPNGSTTMASAMRWQATGGVTLPSTVTGGDKGAGTFNATGLYQANVQVATLSGTEALTNKTYNGNTFTAGTGVLTIAGGKTLTANNTLTISATDGITMTTPTTSFTAARTDAAQTFTGLNTFTNNLTLTSGGTASATAPVNAISFGGGSQGFHNNGGSTILASVTTSRETLAIAQDAVWQYSGGIYGWGSNAQGTNFPYSTPDTGINRVAAGEVGIINGTAATYREIAARSHGSRGTVPGISGCTAGTQTGGATAGTYSSGTSGSCAVTLTFAFTAPTGWFCAASDRTTPADIIVQTASSTTTAVLTGTTVSGDVIGYSCMYY